MSLYRTLFLGLCLMFAVSFSAADDLQPLDDEFNSGATLGNWTRVHAAEGWNADQLETFDFNSSRPGWATLVPRTSTWYENFRGELTYKTVTGDFVASTRVRATNRAGTGAPSRAFSLAGILVRQPRSITPATWTAGGENYVFLSLGCGNTSGTFQYEVKTTVNSVSTLVISSANTSETEIQIARIGRYFILSRRPAGATSWTVHARYDRPDLPSTLQVGMTVYTDYWHISTMDPFVHNSSVITSGTPDLRAEFDYMKFRRPNTPPILDGVNLMNTGLVPDSFLLTFLGDGAVPVGLRRLEME